MDITHDNSWNDLLQITEKLGEALPAYVRKYIPMTKESASTLEDSLFADSRTRSFPIDSPGSTWTSAIYLAYNKDSLPYKRAEYEYVASRINKAASIYGVEKDIKEAIAKLNAVTKVAEHIATKTDAEFPMYDAEGVMKASSQFESYRKRYPHNWRKEIASTIMDKAAEFGVSEDKLSRAVLAEAGYGIPDKRALMEEVLFRSRMAKHAENAVLLGNLNMMIAELPVDAIKNELDKIAEVMAEFDVAEGLDAQYGKKLMPPSDTVYSVSIKEAQAVLDDAIKLNKNIFSATKLASVLTPDLASNLLGEDFAAGVVKDKSNKFQPCKLAAALSALPLDDKVALEEYLQTAYA